MTITLNGARFPGPLGTVPGKWNGRMPGPLDFKQVDLSKAPATKAPKGIPMPAPLSKASTILVPRVADWKLSTNVQVQEDVEQGELANCPVGAILAALVHTKVGKLRVNDLVTEFSGAPVKSTFTPAILATIKSNYNDPDLKPLVAEIISNRYFSVSCFTPSVEVSDVFYAHDGNNFDMAYMNSKNSVLWPAVIEKAYATKLGGYDRLNDEKTSANEFWKVLVGKDPEGGFSIDTSTDLKKITDAAKAAPRIPTMAGTNPNVDPKSGLVGDHAYAVLGTGTKLGLHKETVPTVELYNPWGSPVSVSTTEFRANFQAILFGNP